MSKISHFLSDTWKLYKEKQQENEKFWLFCKRMMLMKNDSEEKEGCINYVTLMYYSGKHLMQPEREHSEVIYQDEYITAVCNHIQNLSLKKDFSLCNFLFEDVCAPSLLKMITFAMLYDIIKHGVTV
jgi:hypothetical protein